MSKILLVVDMQQDFTTGVLGSAAADQVADKVAELIPKASADDYKIVLTRDEHGVGYEDTKEGKFFPPHCMIETEGYFLDPRIKDVVDPDEDYCVCKDTFGSIDLVNVLAGIDAEDPITEIAVCGLVTDICVIVNTIIVASAFPNVKVEVLSEYCAGTSEGAHSLALEVMKGLLIEVR